MKKTALAFVAACAAGTIPFTASANDAVFRSFEYTGLDPVPACDRATEYTNPIMPGMAPDPSITRKGEWFYLAQSSFCYWPGIPIWRSRNLVDWQFVRFAIDRPSQADFPSGMGLSRGVFAPDIKYNPYNDTFYLLVTLVDGQGNVLLKTKDPANGWSNPIHLGFGGIDPGIYFESATLAYIVNNDDAPNNAPEYSGHRTIRCRPYDLENDICRNDEETILVNKGIHPEEKPIWCEGPHLYKIDGRYYLMTAEGGTGGNHSEVIWKGKSPMEPFTPCRMNPILTQRDLPEDRNEPITAAGHADLIEAPWGGWYAVFLGIKPYRSYGKLYANTGRNTYLLPVKWIGEGDDRQPLILEPGKEIPRVVELGVSRIDTAPEPIRQEDKAGPYRSDLFTIRTPTETWWSEDGGSGEIRIRARQVSLSSLGNPSCLCRWLKDHRFEAKVEMDFTPLFGSDFAGLACYQDERHYYAIGRTLAGIAVRKVSGAEERIVAQAPLPPGLKSVHLKIAGFDDSIRLAFSVDGASWREIWQDNATILSTDVAGGFVGATLGLFAE